MDFRTFNRIAISVVMILATQGVAAWAQSLECGTAFYDDGEPVGWAWFDGNKAGRSKFMFAVRFDLADFGYQPGHVEITGICAGNRISAGGLFPNEVFVYPDNEGTPDDSVVLAQGMILTGNGNGESIVMFDKPVVLDGDFWLVNRGYAPYADSDFNMEYDSEADSGHSFVSSDGLENLEESTDGDWVLRAYLEPTDRSYLVAGVAHAPGAADTEWRSGLALLNTSNQTVDATLSYVRSDGTSSQEVSIASGEIISWDDVATELFGIADVTSGSVRVDASRELVVTNRTYNQREVGTVGQFLPGLLASDGLTDGDLGVLSHLASNSAFRTNIGFINFGDKSCRVSYDLHDSSGNLITDGREISLGPSRWRQDNDVFAGTGDQDNAYATVQVLSQECAVWAYASLVDEFTGDPMTIPVVIK